MRTGQRRVCIDCGCTLEPGERGYRLDETTGWGGRVKVAGWLCKLCGDAYLETLAAGFRRERRAG